LKLHSLEPVDGHHRKEFTIDTLDSTDNSNGFLDRVIISNESTFHVCGTVNRHAEFGVSKSPHAVREYERDSLKLNVCYALSRDEVTGSSSSQEKAANSTNYLDMLRCLQSRRWHTFNQMFPFNKMAPLHTGALQEGIFEYNFSKQKDWEERTNHLALMLPDITPLDVFFWGYVKSSIFRPNLAVWLNFMHESTMQLLL
jgi:hypothetical protein